MLGVALQDAMEEEQRAILVPAIPMLAPVTLMSSRCAQIAPVASVEPSSATTSWKGWAVSSCSREMQTSSLRHLLKVVIPIPSLAGMALR